MNRIILTTCAMLLGLSASVHAQDPPDPFNPPPDNRTYPQDPNAAPFGVYDSFGEMGVNFSDVRFFAGKRLDCMKALGGLLNCCKKSPEENQSKNYWDYMKSTMAKSTNAQGAFDLNASGDTGGGGWMDMLGGATADDLMQQFTSNMESLMGGGSEGGGDDQDPTMERANDEYFEYANREVKPRLGWYCDSDEFELAVGRQVGNCTHLGSYCQTRVLGICVIKKDRYCCFNSPVTRVLREDLDRRGVSDLGTARHPKCEGITFEQMQQVSQDSADTDEIVGRMYEGEFMPDFNSLLAGGFTDMESVLDGASSMLGDGTRQNPSDRNVGRIEGTDPGEAYGDIEEDMRGRRPVYESDIGPHMNTVQLLLSQTSFDLRAGQGLQIPVSRNGSSGTVQAQVDPITGTTASVGADYTVTPSMVMWSAGQTQEQEFIVQIPMTATAGRVIILELQGKHTEAGVTRDLELDGETLIMIRIVANP